jgi:hypothetical protein
MIKARLPESAQRMIVFLLIRKNSPTIAAAMYPKAPIPYE